MYPSESRRLKCVSQSVFAAKSLVTNSTEVTARYEVKEVERAERVPSSGSGLQNGLRSVWLSTLGWLARDVALGKLNGE